MSILYCILVLLLMCFKCAQRDRVVRNYGCFTGLFQFTETHRFEHSFDSAYSVSTVPLITHKI
jgi:hypothetical protein